MGVGEKTIDHQHQKILNIANELANFVSDGTNVTLDKLRKTLHSLYEYSNGHFAYEEAYMSKHHYPSLNKHKKLHQKFIQNFDKLKSKLNNIIYSQHQSPYALKEELDNLTEEYRDYIINWWNNHIMIEDHKYSYYIGEEKIEKRKEKT